MNCKDRVISPFVFIEDVLLTNPVGRAFYFQNTLIVFLSFPFKFFIGKEFFFVLIDEIFHKSLSNKIDQLKTYTSTRGVYTLEMIKEVKKDIFQIVRQPYLKYSRLKYNLLVILILLPNYLLAYFYYSSSSTQEFMEIFIHSELFKAYKGAVHPFVMFFLPGLLYYRACIYF